MKRTFPRRRPLPPGIAVGERGSALVFALAMLSLILGTALIFNVDMRAFRNGAGNSGYRANAALLAHSAVNQVALAVNHYQLHQRNITRLAVEDLNGADHPVYPQDLSGVVSQYLKPSGDSADATADKGGCDDALSSRLPVSSSYQDIKFYKNRDNASLPVTVNAHAGQNSYANCERQREESDSLRRPNWVYVTFGDQHEIIGRYAFRVLPPTSSTQLNLGAYLKGEPELSGLSPAGISDIVLETSQLDLSHTLASMETSADPSDSAVRHFSDKLHDDRTTARNGALPVADLIGDFSLFQGSYPERFQTGGSLDSDRVNWFRRHFSDGKVPNDLEVFNVVHNGKNYWYHRYPLRALTTGDNSADAVKKLLGLDADCPAEMLRFERIGGAGGTFAARRVMHNGNPSDGNLFFLNAVGNDPGSFADLGLLRRQIAANLLDYSDADSVPTSDVPSAQWNVTDNAKFPQYTGNEKTLYVNELALRLHGLKMRCDDDGNLSVPQLKFTGFAELINLYDNSDPTVAPLLDPAKLYLETAVKKLYLKVAMRGDYKIRITYSNGVNSYQKTCDVTLDPNYNQSGAMAEIKYDPVAPTVLTMGAAASSAAGKFTALSGGYSTGRSEDVTIASESITYSDSTYFQKQLRNAALELIPAGYSLVKVEVQSVTMSYKLVTDGSSQIEFAPVMLRSAETIADTVTSGDGLDFVRFDLTGAMRLHGASAAVNAPSPDWDHTFAETSFIGGIEARDPRQNLYPDYSDSENSDWNLTPTLLSAASAASGDIPSMSVVTETYDPATATQMISGGYRNRHIDPSAPKYVYDRNGTPTTAAVPWATDRESAADPAYLGAAEDQHLSSAAIRNGEMASFWELGFISRGRAWQTLNLKSSTVTPEDLGEIVSGGAFPGTDYTDGDAALLDVVKFSSSPFSYGMIDLNMLRSAAVGYNLAASNADAVTRDSLLFEELLANQVLASVKTGGKIPYDFDTLSEGTAVRSVSDARCREIAADLAEIAAPYRLRSAAAGLFAPTGNAVDARAEELVGKVMPLLKTDPALVTVFEVDVIAQSIRDLGGVSVRRLQKDGTISDPVETTVGVFDQGTGSSGETLYFDDITGEIRLRAVFDYNPYTGKIALRQVRYLP